MQENKQMKRNIKKAIKKLITKLKNIKKFFKKNKVLIPENKTKLLKLLVPEK